MLTLKDNFYMKIFKVKNFKSLRVKLLDEGNSFLSQKVFIAFIFVFMAIETITSSLVLKILTVLL